MTDEEKKAIEKIEKLIEYLKKWNEDFTIVPKDVKYFEKILDMTKTHLRMIDENIEEILEQSKEIEELNSDLEVFKRALTDIEVVYNKNYTSNDKIKAKIEELDKQEQDLQNSIRDEEREEYSDASISWELMDIHIRRETLQQLLDEIEIKDNKEIIKLLD